MDGMVWNLRQEKFYRAGRFVSVQPCLYHKCKLSIHSCISRGNQHARVRFGISSTSILGRLSNRGAFLYLVYGMNKITRNAMVLLAIIIRRKEVIMTRKRVNLELHVLEVYVFPLVKSSWLRVWRSS